MRLLIAAMPVAFLCVSVDSLPWDVREIETGRRIETVAEYMDTTVGPCMSYDAPPIISEPIEDGTWLLIWVPPNPTSAPTLPTTPEKRPGC